MGVLGIWDVGEGGGDKGGGEGEERNYVHTYIPIMIQPTTTIQPSLSYRQVRLCELEDPPNNKQPQTDITTTTI